MALQFINGHEIVMEIFDAIADEKLAWIADPARPNPEAEAFNRGIDRAMEAVAEVLRRHGFDVQCDTVEPDGDEDL
jgi:broad specificity phosphatase PhoE